MKCHHLSTSSSVIGRDGWRVNCFGLRVSVPAQVLSLWLSGGIWKMGISWWEWEKWFGNALI